MGALVSGGAGSVIAWVVLVAFAAAAIFLIVRAVQLDRRRSRDSVGDAELDVHPDDRRPVAAWDADATRFEAEGRWRDALRCRYRSLVASLARAGVVDEVPGRTAGEYRAVVGQTRPSVAEPFAGATDLFERAWYGNEETGPDDTSSFRRLAERVTAGTGSSS